jgi:hypothetical protein
MENARVGFLFAEQSEFLEIDVSINNAQRNCCQKSKTHVLFDEEV